MPQGFETPTLGERTFYGRFDRKNLATLLGKNLATLYTRRSCMSCAKPQDSKDSCWRVQNWKRRWNETLSPACDYHTYNAIRKKEKRFYRMNILAVYRVLLIHSVFCVILVDYQAKLPLDFQILNQTSGRLGQHMTHLAILENETMSRFIPRIIGISTQGNVTRGVGLASRVSEEFVSPLGCLFLWWMWWCRRSAMCGQLFIHL